jgi:cytochrome P450
MGTAHGDFADSISLTDLYADPYPIYRTLREIAPVAWVPVAGRYLVTRHQDITALEKQPEIFSAAEDGSLMTRVMGHTLLRKDGDAHRRERAAAEPPLRPRIVEAHWRPKFEANANELIDSFVDRGEADLFDEFCGPLAARNLAMVLGLDGVSDIDMQRWSQAMMDGGGNYADDPEVWERARRAGDEIDAAVADTVARVSRTPDESVISAMIHAPDPLDIEQIRANVKVFIGGGLNEPRDSMSVAIWAVLTNPATRDAVVSDPSLWRSVFEEAIRWVAPIGMYPRQVAQRVELGGVTLEPGSKLGICVGSANRDESVFERPDEFDIFRPSRPHVAFGGGPHFCLGTWVARAQVAQVALPTLFHRIAVLAGSPHGEVRLGGWVFRGLLTLPVVWTPS